MNPRPPVFLENLTARLIQIVEAATRFQRWIRSRNLREYLVAAFLVVLLAAAIVRAPSGWARVPPSLIILVLVSTMHRIHKKGWIQRIPSNRSPAAYREIYRRELARQRDLLPNAWKGFAIMFVSLVVLLFATPAPVAATLELRCMGLATYSMGFVLLAKLNRLAARKLSQRLKTLDGLEPR
jgi:hypothetical protein